MHQRQWTTETTEQPPLGRKIRRHEIDKEAMKSSGWRTTQAEMMDYWNLMISLQTCIRNKSRTYFSDSQTNKEQPLRLVPCCLNRFCVFSAKSEIIKRLKAIQAGFGPNAEDDIHFEIDDHIEEIEGDSFDRAEYDNIDELSRLGRAEWEKERANGLCRSSNPVHGWLAQILLLVLSPKEK